MAIHQLEVCRGGFLYSIPPVLFRSIHRRISSPNKNVSRGFLDSKPEQIATTEIKSNDIRLYYSDNHYQDWVDAINKRSVPITGVETGHRSASVCNLANIAYKLNRTLEWDPEKEKFKGDGEANKLRTKKYRKPYTL